MRELSIEQHFLQFVHNFWVHPCGISWVDFDEFRTSTFSLIRKTRIDSSPGYTVDAPVHTGIVVYLFQFPEIQIFNANTGTMCHWQRNIPQQCQWQNFRCA